MRRLILLTTLMLLFLQGVVSANLEVQISPEKSSYDFTRIEGISYYSLNEVIKLNVIMTNIDPIRFDKDSVYITTSVDGYQQQIECNFKTESVVSLAYECYVPPFEVTTLEDTYTFNVKIHFIYDGQNYEINKQISIAVNVLSPQPLSLQLESYTIEGEDLEAKAYHKSCMELRDIGEPLTIKLYFNSNFLNPKYMKINNLILNINGIPVNLLPLSVCTSSVTDDEKIEVICQVNNLQITNLFTCSDVDLAINDQVNVTTRLNVNATMGDNENREFSFTFPLQVTITSLMSESEIKTYIQQNANYEVFLNRDTYTFRNIEGTDYYELIEDAYVVFKVLGIDTDYISSVVMKTSLDGFNEEIQCQQNGDYYKCPLPTISGHYGSSLPSKLYVDVLFTYIYENQEFNTQHNLTLNIGDVVHESFTLSFKSYSLVGGDLEGSIYNDDSGTYCMEMYDGGENAFHLILYPDTNYQDLGEGDLIFNNFRLTIVFSNGASRTFSLNGVECNRVYDDQRLRYDCIFPNLHVLAGMLCSNTPVSQGGVLSYQGIITFDVYYLGRIYASDVSIGPYDSTFTATTILQELSSAFTTNIDVFNAQIKCNVVQGSDYCVVANPSGYIDIDIVGIPANADFSLTQGTISTSTDENYEMNCEIIDHQDLSVKFRCYFDQGTLLKLDDGKIMGDFNFLTTLNNGVSYVGTLEHVTFNADVVSYSNLSYNIVDATISAVPSDNEGRLSCTIDENYKCDISSSTIVLKGRVITNAPDLVANVINVKLILDTGNQRYNLTPSCNVNSNTELYCNASLRNVDNFTYVPMIGIFAYYASGDHIDEEFASATIPVVIPNELLSTYSNITFNGEIVFLSNDIFKTSTDGTANLPVCIIPVNVGKYYNMYNQDRLSTGVSTQHIWDILRGEYGYGNVNYDQPLCSFAASSIGIIITVPEMYHTDDFELHSIYYSLGNARDFYSATCVPLSSNNDRIEWFKVGERGMKFYCMLPNLDFLMDDFTGAIPYTTQVIEVPMYIKLAVRDGPWEREGTLAIPFRFLMENSYGTLTEKLNSLKQQKEKLEKLRDKINGIASRATRAAIAVAVLDAGFGTNAFGGRLGKLSMLSVARHSGCAVGCLVQWEEYGECRASNRIGRNPYAVGTGGGICAAPLDYAYVCTLGGALLMGKSMKGQLEHIEKQHEEVTNEIYDVEDRLMEGDSYSSIYLDLRRQYDAKQNGYHRSFVMDLPEAVSGIVGAIYSTICTLMGFTGFSGATKEIVSKPISTRIATSLLTTGINSWVYEDKIDIGKMAVGTATSLITNKIGGELLSGHETLRWLTWGPTLFGLYQAIEEKPEGMSTLDSVLYFWGSWSFSTGISAASQAIVDITKEFIQHNWQGENEIEKILNDENIKPDSDGWLDDDELTRVFNRYFEQCRSKCEVISDDLDENKYWIKVYTKEGKLIYSGVFTYDSNDEKWDFNFGSGTGVVDITSNQL